VRDRGSTTVLVAAILSVVVLCGGTLLWVQSLVVAKAAAQTAADAAALAAAASGDPRVAASVAEANGATLVECRCRSGPVVLVVVERVVSGAVTVRAGARSERIRARPYSSP
jgi:secretion/DNA translocation related TadE-like protein